ncbi:MAG: amidohydrolase family protein [Polyangiaceae bacterium]
MSDPPASSPTRWLASRRVVLGEGDALRIVPAILEMTEPTIGRVEELEEERYAERIAEASDAGDEVIDHGDRLVSPAFVNAHTHLSLGMLRGFDLAAAARGNMVEELFFAVESTLTAEDVRAFTRMGAYESLLGGVGLVWDHYYFGETVADALAEVGLSGVVAPTLQDLSGPGKDVHDEQLDATARIDDRADLRARGIFAALGPHATDTVSDRLWRKALQMATTRRLPLHAHLAQSPEEVQRAQRRHGLSPVGWLDRLGILERAPSTVLAHAIYVSRQELEQLASGRHRLVWCPMSALVFGLPARIGVWSAHGVPWALATDCASNNDTNNVQAELRLIAAQRTMGASWSSAYERVLGARDGVGDEARRAWDERASLFAQGERLADPANMLARVWSIPGRAHPGVVAGVIETGALCNLVVWDLDHPALWPSLDPLHVLAMADATKAIFAMVVAGRAVGIDGDFQRSLVDTDAYREARAEATARVTRLLEAVAG